MPEPSSTAGLRLSPPVGGGPVATAGPRATAFQPPQGELAILAGSGNPQLAAAIAGELGTSLTPCEAIRFSEGNLFVRVQENVRGRDCFVVQGVHRPVNDHFMELLFWVDALKRASAQSVTAVIPYFGYAKGDKKDEPRVSIRARVCADAIEAAGADRVLTMDLHSPQIQGFFRIPVDHLYARYQLCREVQGLIDELPHANADTLTVCAPDVGFAKGASGYAHLLGCPVVIGHKERTGHDEAARVLQVIGDVQGRTVLIVDDFTISGGTLLSMAELLREQGATEVLAAVSHAVLPGEAAQRFAGGPISRLLVTDTIEPLPDPLPSEFRVVSMARVFAEAIRSVHDRTSVSALFPE